MSNLPTGKPYARLSDFALDPTSVYGSYSEAVSYASDSPVAYVGQLIGVREGSTCNVYVIEPTRTLKRVGSVSESGELVMGYQAFGIGDVLWQDAGQNIPIGWLPAGEPFGISEYPALYALYGTSVTPDFPMIDGKRAIILARYVDNVRIPTEGFIETYGINQAKEEQLIAASNTIIAQMKHEDDERKRILATLGPPALASDDLPTLHARLKRCLNRLSEKLSNKGVLEPADSGLDKLIDRIEDIESTSSSLRIESFTAAEQILLEKNANQVLSRLSLVWNYSDDAQLKYQSLTGPGSIAIDESVRSVTLAPNVKDGEFEFTLTAVDRDDREIKRSLLVRYVQPIYWGVTQTYDIQPNEILLGTRQLVSEGSFPAEYESILGYMYLAVPREWIPFATATDPHGFDYLQNSLRILDRTLTTPDGTAVPYRVYISRRYNTLDNYAFHFKQ